MDIILPIHAFFQLIIITKVTAEDPLAHIGWTKNIGQNQDPKHWSKYVYKLIDVRLKIYILVFSTHSRPVLYLMENCYMFHYQISQIEKPNIECKASTRTVAHLTYGIEIILKGIVIFCQNKLCPHTGIYDYVLKFNPGEQFRMNMTFLYFRTLTTFSACKNCQYLYFYIKTQ